MILNQQVCFTVHKLARQFDQLYRPLLERFELTYPQYLVLLVLWEENQLSVTQIGERVQLNSGTLSPMLKRMEASQLVLRQRSQTDERKVVIVLTDKAKILEADVKAAVVNCFGALDLPVEQEENILAKLNDLITVINKGSNIK
ncbi:MarR family winged helix-turn-helix transcriptional regulator [Brochothrix campestris]|uniref:Transcriptional regulator n=1 Tax=Brochothrix campestris FSL F6-1037 TaxID=1265861 RepID=W7CUZ9_9LIST|nr:MarR family transcriptional regulator [Brochothrix campestris]EUJ40490.1 transcriptional regulator [Brochothrix campestris FSL F6-1037]